MYKIMFESQPRHDEPDVERDSIELTKEEYAKLPKLAFKTFDRDCTFTPVMFSERVRHPQIEYPAVRVYNPNWQIDDENLIHKEFYWFFVCLDIEEDVWIAFKTWDEAYWCDAYGSTVGISEPRHGRIYRLDDGCKKVCKRFYG